MRVLITGDKGFVGKHLRAHLELQGHEVFGFDIVDGRDICNENDIKETIKQIKPQQVYHLAAQTFVPKSFSKPQLTTLINVIGTINLLEAVKGTETRVLLASTGYAQTMSSPYTISKLAMEYFAQFYYETYAINLVITRAYNHTGPGQSDDFMTASFVKQAKESNQIEHGNLEQLLNFTDVRDVVRAYELAIKQPVGVYSICSEQNVTVKEILNTLIEESGKKIKTKVNQKFFRPTLQYEAPVCNLSGWKAEIPMRQTLKDML